MIRRIIAVCAVMATVMVGGAAMASASTGRWETDFLAGDKTAIFDLNYTTEARGGIDPTGLLYPGHGLLQLEGTPDSCSNTFKIDRWEFSQLVNGNYVVRGAMGGSVDTQNDVCDNTPIEVGTYVGPHVKWPDLAWGAYNDGFGANCPAGYSDDPDLSMRTRVRWYNNGGVGTNQVREATRDVCIAPVSGVAPNGKTNGLQKTKSTSILVSERVVKMGNTPYGS